MQLKFRYLLLFLFVVLLLILVGLFFEAAFTPSPNHPSQLRKHLPLKKILNNYTNYAKTKRNCRFYSCFNLFKCHVNNDWNIKVYVYPEIRFVTEENQQIFPEATKEFQEIIASVKGSKFWTNKSTEACIFLPNVDLLSERAVQTEPASKAISSLEFWNDGENHVIFNFFQRKSSSANALTVNIGKALIASADFNQLNFRHKFDIVIPVLNSFINTKEAMNQIPSIGLTEKRKWLLTIQYGIVTNSMKTELENIIDSNRDSVLHLTFCDKANLESATRERCMENNHFKYPNILRRSTFCLVIPSAGLWKTFLVDAMMNGCIPVVLQEYLLPFLDVIDWKRASVSFNENQVNDLLDILKDKDINQLAAYRKQVLFLWQEYFSSLSKVTLATLEIFNDRVSPHKARKYEDWNGDIKFGGNDVKIAGYPPLFLPLSPPLKQGYTAVILTFNRNKVLFQLINHLDKCPSLDKIVIIWNNPKTEPPDASKMPIVTKPMVIIKAKANKLSNRFYPYKEIETEAILSIDDDISMLTVDELEFGFEVWKRHLDRIVGFPGRNHKHWSQNNQNGFLYQSEWTNDVSMVLTGVAFYHKIYNHLFTYRMPKAVIRYIDEKMNCEDIAMNFLIANMTKKSPIKVTTRKRFICPQCSSNESLWSETSHFVKRSECLKEFTKQFGHMPLQRVEFRADPILFKENVPIELQAFPNVGSV